MTTFVLETLPDGAVLEGHGSALVKCADTLAESMTRAEGQWGGMSAAYHAPESATVYSALATPRSIVDEIGQTTRSAQTALDNYSATLSTLKTQRSNLLLEITAFGNLDAEVTVDFGQIRSTLRADVARFNANAIAADEECASALGTLMRYQPLWGTSVFGAANSLPGGAVQGLAAELMARYRTLSVPTPGAVLPLVLRIDAIVPDEIIKGVGYTRLPSGLLVKVGTLTSPLPTTIPLSEGWQSKPVLTGAPNASAPPTWARTGGKVLGVAGVGLTVWGQYSDQYNSDLEAHPEWDDGDRVASATQNAVIVGGASAAGGAGGAWGGALAGAAIGSIFPGPGTLIGGIVGGVIGGVAGGWGGAEIGKGIRDTWNGLFG
ncbi:hypothetical protein E3O25_09525 [Cryobacterium sp. TMT1-3]|uniref:hypothetical protein n=1 Tax=Cryobacterium sp. TMT1-3 TaxID=1259237 RepID=UPI00106B66D4|nr:hypothetical protein [Cryobacterium sp. TMT1-3]TFC27347.1 hypothetical protein E3O25_09525 [Cryobacterium sp. TMT1-3]